LLLLGEEAGVAVVFEAAAAAVVLEAVVAAEVEAADRGCVPACVPPGVAGENAGATDSLLCLRPESVCSNRVL
jgi:hypothetical protein